MKNKKILFIILGVVLFILVGSCIYINFIAKSSSAVSYIILANICIGVIASIVTLFLGSNVYENKDNYKVMNIAFLEILVVLGFVILDTVYGYHKVLNIANYKEYMEYVSMTINVYLYIAFAFFIGILNFNLFVKNKLAVKEQ